MLFLPFHGSGAQLWRPDQSQVFRFAIVIRVIFHCLVANEMSAVAQHAEDAAPTSRCERAAQLESRTRGTEGTVIALGFYLVGQELTARSASSLTSC